MGNFIVNLTHDVDFIKKTYQYITHDLVKLNFANIARRFGNDEPFWTFEKIMNIEERAGCRSTFFFLEESIPFNVFKINRWNLTLGKYSFTDPKVVSLVRELYSRGWEIALHGSFYSYKKKELLIKEKKDLEEALSAPVYGIRQHFLNMEIPNTWKIQKEAGFRYDASLGRRRNIGFHQNHYLPLEHKGSGMLIIPLTIMDSYLSYVTKGNAAKAWQAVLKIIDQAEKHNAVLSLLWHNNYFNENEHPGFSKLYSRILRECSSRGAEFMTCNEVYQKFSGNLMPEETDDNVSKKII